MSRYPRLKTMRNAEKELMDLGQLFTCGMLMPDAFLPNSIAKKQLLIEQHVNNNLFAIRCIAATS
jgi:hypothetical protein